MCRGQLRNDYFSFFTIFVLFISTLRIRKNGYSKNTCRTVVQITPIYCLQHCWRIHQYPKGYMNTLGIYYAHPMRYTLYKPEPIMLSVLPIIPSRISHNFYILFLFYSHAITYYSCYIL